jgi:hypothetical protein
MSAESYAKRQKELLSAMYDEAELIQEGGHKSNGPGDGYFLSFRFRNDTDEMLLAKAIYLTWGPIAGELLLLSPEEAGRDRDRSFSAIERSFSFRPMDFLAKEAGGPLLGQIPEADGTAVIAPTKYPFACVAISTPPGWAVTSTEYGEVVLSKSGTEIRLRRILQHGTRPDSWFKERLQQLRASGSLVLGFEQSRLARGPYAALWFDEKGLARTWKAPGAPQTQEVFLADQQPLLWIFRSPEARFLEARSELEQLIAATTFLPSEEWKTRLAEPWIDYTLSGPWRPESTGLYLRSTGSPLLLQVDNREKSPSLEMIQSTCNTEGFRRAHGIGTSLSASDVKGLWRGHEALRFSLDGLSATHAPLSLRAGWFLVDRVLYSVIVKGEDPREVESLHLELLEGLRFPSR